MELLILHNLSALLHDEFIQALNHDAQVGVIAAVTLEHEFELIDALVFNHVATASVFVSNLLALICDDFILNSTQKPDSRLLLQKLVTVPFLVQKDLTGELEVLRRAVCSNPVGGFLTVLLLGCPE